MITFLLLLLISSAAQAQRQFAELRDGQLFIRTTNTVEIAITYQATYLAVSNPDDVYVQAPNGQLTEHCRFAPGDIEGERTVILDDGPGDYCITLATQNHRSFTFDIPKECRAVYSPRTYYITMHARDTLAWYFRVPQGVSRLSVGGRRDVNSLTDTMEVRGPDGALRAVLDLPTATYDAYNPYDSLVALSPEPGWWSVRFPDRNAIPKVAFWVQGVPNIFCRDTAEYFLPEGRSGYARIVGDIADQGGRLRSRGMIGATTVGGVVDPRALRLVESLGLESCEYYLSHGYREVENDNGDPFTLNPQGFNWNDDVRIQAYTEDPLHVELLHVITAADWLGEPLLTTQAHHEMAEFVEAYLLHHNVEEGRQLRYFTLQDEPNAPQRGYTREAYLQLLRTVGERLIAHPEPGVRDARILVAGSTNFLFPNHTDESWAGAAWAEEAYSCYDSLIGGISMHIWDRKSTLNVHRFAEEIAEARRIIETHDQDGDLDEAIVIDQTCASSGSSISPFLANGFDAALWWGAVATTCLNTGVVTSVNWFSSVDDPHHRKGLAFLDGDSLMVKPVGHAMRFLTTHCLDSVLTISSSHPEVHVLATIDSAYARLSLIAVNSGQRTVTAGIEVDAPAAMTGSFSCEHDMLRDGATFESIVNKPVVTGPSFRFSADLPPRSLSAFECMRLPADVRPRPRSTGWRIGQPYPNPFTGAMTIGIGSLSGGTLQVRVFDMLGRRIRTLHDGWAAPGSLSLRWNGHREDGQKCPPGAYTIQVLSGEKLTVRPVLFQ